MTPHFTPEFWAHAFDGIALTIIMWIGRAIWWSIKKGNEQLEGMVQSISDGPAKKRADEVRIETKAQFAVIQKRLDEQDAKMDDHEVRDQKRHDEIMTLIQKKQTA